MQSVKPCVKKQETNPGIDHTRSHCASGWHKAMQLYTVGHLGRRQKHCAHFGRRSSPHTKHMGKPGPKWSRVFCGDTMVNRTQHHRAGISTVNPHTQYMGTHSGSLDTDAVCNITCAPHTRIRHTESATPLDHTGDK